MTAGSPATPVSRAPRSLRAAAGLLALTAVTAAACSSGSTGPRLKVTGAYVPRPASPDVAAAYFTISDSGDKGDELTGVTADVSAQAMMHQSTGRTMRMVDRVPVPAHGRLTFAPGGYHVMLEHPTRSLREGDHVRLTLRFRRSASITVDAPVEPVGYRPGASP
ncbi:copper chaperone PCu(A)C [Actinoallomurus soli]|uniref:copper chaperone PCu(A)C n=1 Tax=Actinoallomurus soli TaxID=2952535 RepID=UPI002092FEAB|nr:copper chaperone PCu(A)C [Actinoallomurus soli]MCO5968382.1 copper chaperone PCu(A)C [Actinoallomurus soli]